MGTTEGFIGHVVYPDTRATISEFSYGFANQNCSTNRALIAKRSQVSNGASQSWEVIWRGYGSNHAAGFMRSGPVGKVLEPGAYYALLVGFDCGTSSSGINRSSVGVTGFDVGIGSTVGSVSKSGSYTPLGPGDFVTMNFDGLQDLYRTEVVVVEL